MHGSNVVEGFGLAGQAERLLALPGPFHIRFNFNLSRGLQPYTVVYKNLTKSLLISFVVEHNQSFLMYFAEYGSPRIWLFFAEIHTLTYFVEKTDAEKTEILCH